ncbi:MAG: hypothetical protein AAB692_05175 [Patescibacteria group bacterium]
MKNTIAAAALVLTSACSFFVPAQQPDTGSTDSDQGEPELTPVPDLRLEEATAEYFSVRPGEESVTGYTLTFSADEDIDFTGLGTYVNRGDGANMQPGDVTLAGRFTFSDDNRVYIDEDGASIEPYGNSETCEVRDGIVTKGPCYFSRFSEYLKIMDPPVHIMKGGKVTLKFKLNVHWRAGNSDGYRVYIRVLTFQRPGEDGGYQSVLFGYRGPAIKVQDTASFCDLRDLGVYGSQGCCDSQGFRPAAHIGGGVMVTAPLMKTVFLGLENNTLARFPSSREMASWYGRPGSVGLADLDDHSVCNLVRAASLDDLLGLNAAATVGLKPGEWLVRKWDADQLFVIDRHKTLRRISLETAATIYGPSLDERILFLTDDDLGTPGQPGSYNIGADVLSAADFDPVAVSAAAVMQEEIN